MTRGHSRLGSAQVRWNDYRGTAAADDADAILKTRSLYEIAGLDREAWSIVGVDFSFGDPGQDVVVYATSRTQADPLDGEGDQLEVSAFTLGPSVKLDEFLAEAFNRVSVRLLSSAVGAKELLVTEGRRPPG